MIGDDGDNQEERRWKLEVKMVASVGCDEAGRYGGDDAVDFREGMKVTMVCSEDGGETELKWW